MLNCPICSFSENPDDSVYCTECGGKIAEESQPEPQVVAPPPPAQPEPQVVAPPPPADLQNPGGILVLPDNSNIQVETAPKTIGRMELINYLKTLQGVDPMTISRQHFTISQENNTCYVEDGNTVVQDKASSNRTFLNGVDITDKGQQELKNDDVIDLANTVKLTFRL